MEPTLHVSEMNECRPYFWYTAEPRPTYSSNETVAPNTLYPSHFTFIFWAVAHMYERINSKMIPDWPFLGFGSSTLSQVLPEFFAMIHCIFKFRISEFVLRRLHHKFSRDQMTAYEFVRQRRVERGLFRQPVFRDHQRTTCNEQILHIFRIFTSLPEWKHTKIYHKMNSVLIPCRIITYDVCWWILTDRNPVLCRVPPHRELGPNMK